MLVLSRKVGERIFVPSLGLVITVVQIKGNRVRLGITAPPNILVQREEIMEKKEPDLVPMEDRLGWKGFPDHPLGHYQSLRPRMQ